MENNDNNSYNNSDNNSDNDIIEDDEICRPSPLIRDNQPLFECPQCNRTFNNENSITDHFMLVHCNQDAGNIAYGDNSGSDSDLAIKSNPNGKYKCLFCSKNYSTEEILGEHFLRKHNEFDTMGKLDTKSHIVGFPGSDILEHIGMIETYFTKLSFDYFIRKQFQEQNEQNIDTPNVATSVPNSEPIKCIMCDEQYNIEIIEDNNSAGKSELVRPIIMKCCKKSICETCLQSHLNNTKSCSCPFCRKDHTRYDLDYIKIIDETGDTNSSWLKWRMAHPIVCSDKLG